MSRVINPDGAGKERTRLTKEIALAIHELAKQVEPGIESRDLAAFIALALHSISKTIDLTVAPWEKRDYWVKAGRFRMEWAWSRLYAEKMKKAALNEDWSSVVQIASQTAQKLRKIIISMRHRPGQPWVGAWEELKKQSN